MIKKSVLMGITLSETGGAQKVVYDLLAGLSEDRFSVTLACKPGGELLDWIADLNQQRRESVEVLLLPDLHREIKPVSDLKVLLHLHRFMRRGRFDVAHFHSSKMGILGRVAAFLAGVPTIIFTVHGWGINDRQAHFSQSIFRIAERIVGKMSTHIVCVSDYDRRNGIANDFGSPQRMKVIYNGVPPTPAAPGKLRFMLGLAQDTPLIGFVGRLADAKHPELIVRVAKTLLERGEDNFHLAIVGDGPLRPVCEGLIAEWGLARHVTLLGNQPKAASLIRDLDAMLLLSRYESFPLVILEAMQAGVPVIATPVGGVPEQIEDGVSGFLVGPDAEKAAQRIAMLIQNPDLRQRIGEAARERGKRFSFEAMIEGYQQLYE